LLSFSSGGSANGELSEEEHTVYKGRGKFDSCHHNSVKLGVMLKIMPLNGMIFNMRSNFKKLEWHQSN
jgi:hypothetical protein